MTPQRLRRNIMIPLGIILVLLVAVIMFIFYSSQKRTLLDEVKLKRDSAANLYASLIDKEAETMMGLLDLLVADDRLVAPWRNNDLEGLKKAGEPLYRRFNSKYRITHFYFLETDGKVMLRLHAPERRGDRISRITFLGAKRTHKPYYGVELGPLGTFTLRVVTPVVRAGTVIGYMELGEEIAHLTGQVRRAVGVELMALIDKKLVDQEEWEEGRLIVGGIFVPWERYGNHVVTGLTIPELADIPESRLGDAMSDQEVIESVDLGNRVIMACSIPLRDAGNNVVGRLFSFIDETNDVVSLERLNWLMVLGSLTTAGTIFLYFFYRIGREEAKVKEEHLDEMLTHSRSRMAEQQHFIAEISLARDTIQAQSVFLQTILDAIPLPVYYKDNEGRYLGCNIAFEEFFGKYRVEIAGKTIPEVFANPYRMHEASDRTLLEGKSSIDYEAILPSRDGALHDMLVRKARFQGEGEQLGGIVAAMFDITEIKAARKELKESEERLRSIFDNARIGITLNEGDGSFLSVNQGFCKMLGYTAEELKTSGFNQLTDERDVVAGVEEWEMLRSGKAVRIDYEARLKAKDGRIVTVHLSANRMMDQSEGESRAVTIVQDQHERLKAEEARDMLAKAVECADESIVLTDPNSRILYVNPAFERLSGYSSAELLGRTPALLKSGKHSNEFYDELWKTLKSGEVWRGTFVNRKKNGEFFEEDAAISSVRDDEGNILYYVGVKRDITREMELEASLRHAQKMEAVGTLASGVSHDFNNILHAISGLAQVALVGGHLVAKDREYLELIMDTAARGADLVSRILTFSRHNEPERKTIDLNREIAEILKVLSKAVPKDVVFDVALSADLSPVSAAPDQVHQIMMNLCANAWDAMPGGGTIRIRTRNMEWPEEVKKDLPAGSLDSCVELSVADEGDGMDAKTMERIFDPFFTTKPVGKGTGLGLATVYGIVRSHGGVIQCKSEPGEGTEFVIYLPSLAERRKVERVAEAAQTELKGGTETVLLVDDDASILRTTRELLESFGYRVLAAASGEEALDIFSAKAPEIAMTIMDLGMPGMGGRKCLAEVLRLYPGARVLIASGYDAAEEKTLEGAAGYLRKPFRMKDLLAAVRKILDELKTNRVDS